MHYYYIANKILLMYSNLIVLSLYAFSDIINKDLFYNAKYLQEGNHVNQIKFGDIIALAHGRLERNSENCDYSIVEMNNEENCIKVNCTVDQSSVEHLNITAFWMVEKIRHRDVKRGHRYELKITIYPLKRGKFDNKRDTLPITTNDHPKTRSFLIRDKDYPKYFDDRPLNSQNHIQKRTFEVSGPSAYDNFRVPLNLEYYKKSHVNDLNTGEYFIGGGHNIGETSTFYGKDPYPTAFSQLLHEHERKQVHRPNQIRFPIDKDDTSNEYYDPINTTPLTATHLHHHYYLNKKNLPLLKTSVLDKESIFEQSPFRINVTPQKLNENAAPSTTIQTTHQHNLSADIFGAPTASAYPIYSEYSNGHNFPLQIQPNYNFAEHQQGNFQLPHNIQHTQLPSTAPFTTGIHNPQFSSYNSQYPYQLIPPPHQYFNQEDNPLTTVPYSNNNQHFPTEQQQHHQQQLQQQYNNLPANGHPRYNAQVNAIHGSFQPFHGNEKYENNKFSDPDPIYHQLQQQNYPLPYYPLDQYQNQHNQPYVNQPNPYPPLPLAPPSAQSGNIYNKDPHSQQEQHGSTTAKGNYDIIPTVKQTQQSAQQNFETSEKNQQEIHTEQPSAPAENNKNYEDNHHQTNYPDSINAQLPPPEQGDDTNVPYVESSIVTQTSQQINYDQLLPTTEQIQEFTQNTKDEQVDENKTEAYVHQENLEKEIQKSTKLNLVSMQRPKVHRSRGHYRQKTTEKPILKWMPKRIKPQVNPEIIPTTSTTTASTTTTEPYITITPSQYEEVEAPRTSVSTSISIKVGSNEDEAVKSEERPQRKVRRKYKTFLPTVLPKNVKLTRGNLTAVHTNTTDLHLFRASEEKYDKTTTTTTDDIDEEQQIQQSIIEHAQTLKKK